MALAAAIVTLAGCGRGGETTHRPQTAAPTEPTFQDFGDIQVHYNAVRSDFLTPEVARHFGIERAADRVLLNVSMLREDGTGRTTPIDGNVEASAHNLNGQLKNLEVRRIVEGPSIYFIGEVRISGAEILVFDIEAAPEGASKTYSMQFKREFFAD